MISLIKSIDLGSLTEERLELLLKNELYINIDSPFAVEIIEELESRQQMA